MIIKELLPEYIAKVRQEFGEEGVNRFLELVQETGQQAIDDFLEWRREAEKPKPQEATPCRFGDGPAIARFALDQGCIAFPDDRVQDLCAYHCRKAQPLGSFEIIEDYLLDGGMTLVEWLSM